MHLVLPFASALSPAAGQALSTLQLPVLEQLLSRLTPEDTAPAVAQVGTGTGPDRVADTEAELSLSLPHERLLAGLWGWPLADWPDGLLPLAAQAAREDGLPVDAAPAGCGWGLCRPTHWHVGTEQVSLTNPDTLELPEDEARQIFEALRPLFEDVGWQWHWAGPTRWYAAHASLASLPTAALDRVVGRNVDWWLNMHPDARLLRRLQAEAQMLLYTLPLNATREAAGQLPVNSFWLSGTGPTQPPVRPLPGLQVDERLRAPALAEDWAAWAEAWAELEAGPLRQALAGLQAGHPLRLSLCGERHARSWSSEPARAWWRRLLAPRVHAAPLLAAL